MKIEEKLRNALSQTLTNTFAIANAKVSLQPTRKEYNGDFTYVVFPLAKELKQSPKEIGQKLGEALKEQSALIQSFEVVQGFLNLTLTEESVYEELRNISASESHGNLPSNGKTVLVEFSSPNTNKPLHLGHLRTNFLGDSVSRILAANGFRVVKACLVNDRGIHISKSMLAYQKEGNGATPNSTHTKGDHFVGDFYVLFDKEHKAQVANLVKDGKSEEDAEKAAEWMLEAQNILVKWEQGDTETLALWREMNGWVYKGFEETYRRIGVTFDKIYYESETYSLGRKIVEEGLGNGVFFKKGNGSIWADLTADGLDEKLLLRADGTSVYITQDLGTTDLKYQDFHPDQMIWVVGNEQDYHFKALFSLLARLRKPYVANCYHLSYGMVDLPSGRMKSREGTVVDADDLLVEMVATARNRTMELGKLEDFESPEAEKLYTTLALGALKYFLLKVEPKKRMLFNPEESIDFQGHTGPFIQYTHARICSVLRKAIAMGIKPKDYPKEAPKLLAVERKLIFDLAQYENVVAEAGKELSPSLISMYVYDLAKTFNQFYAEAPILSDAENARLRVTLSALVAETIKHAMLLLGIEVPERM